MNGGSHEIANTTRCGGGQGRSQCVKRDVIVRGKITVVVASRVGFVGLR